MSELPDRQTLLAINSTEWLNLCARGSIRMARRRPIVVSRPASEREMERVFAAAPFTKLESSADVFVLEIDETWTKMRPGHRSFPSEIGQLNLDHVRAHQPVALEHIEYYRNLGDRCGISLADPIFEKHWIYWVTNETISASIDSAAKLQRAFGVAPSSETRRTDKYKWDDIARLVLRPNESIKTKPSHVETLVSSIRRIADAVAATRDSEKFYLACAIEWIDVRLGKDPLVHKQTRDVLLAALAGTANLPLQSPSEITRSALNLIGEVFPRAFTDEISPIFVAQCVQLLTEARTMVLSTETLLRIIHSHDHDSPSATLVTFLLASALGVELTNQLIRTLAFDAPGEIEWHILG